MFIKAGDSETKEGLKVEEATGERMSERKGTLETGSGGPTRMSCHCPLLLWLQVSGDPLEFRKKTPEIQGKGLLL